MVIVVMVGLSDTQRIGYLIDDHTKQLWVYIRPRDRANSVKGKNVKNVEKLLKKVNKLCLEFIFRVTKKCARPCFQFD